jgi:hypothetical protein
MKLHIILGLDKTLLRYKPPCVGQIWVLSLWFLDDRRINNGMRLILILELTVGIIFEWARCENRSIVQGPAGCSHSMYKP